jgi:beta-xylosidase
MIIRIGSTALASLLLCTVGLAETKPDNEFRVLKVDAGTTSGIIRSFQAVNGQPTPMIPGLPNVVQQYREMRIDMVRTHDMMGPADIDARFSLSVPGLIWLIPNLEQRTAIVKNGNASSIFPDWSADPEAPASYNFGPTDKVIEAIRGIGAEIYYRIGRSWGANADLPPDFDKFAAVVKHVAMHYNQGWANGYHDRIRYWEFWNEPELGIFWSGTPEQFYGLYEKTVRALKSADPSVKVGAVAKAFSLAEGPYREDFFDYCVAHHVPLDFYSWHTYADASADPYDVVRIGQEIRRLLDAKGFRTAENCLSEWGLSADFTDAEKPVLQGIENAAFMGAAMVYLQDSPVDRAIFYRGDAAWVGLFGLHGEYFKPAYTFRATGAMRDTPERLPVTGADTFGFAVLAGRSHDGRTLQVLISNYRIPEGYKPHHQEPPEGLFPNGI